MRISQFKYSQIQNAVQNKKLMLSFDDNDEDENIFIGGNQKWKMQTKLDSKSSIKDRLSSANTNKRLKTVQNIVSNSSMNFRPATATSIRKGQKPTNDTQKINARPRTATNRFFTSSQEKKAIKYDIFHELSQQIKDYFMSIYTNQEKKQILEELKLILNILQKQTDLSAIFLQLQKLQDHLSRFLRHRISHLYFYLIYCKFYSCFSNQPLKKEVKFLSLVEYHARSFHFRKVTLILCLQLQQKYIKMTNFQQSRNYAIKSLKLAVLLNDRYEEIKMLEYLGVIRFYQGTLNLRGNNQLTEQERLKILKHYNQYEEMPKIFNFLDKNSTKEQKGNQVNKENQISQKSLLDHLNQEKVYFNQGQNFVHSNVPGSNLKKFNRNFHGINKKINRNNPVKETIKKINSVGQVKKFIGKDNFITLYPQANTIKSKHQIQVLVTHKKYIQIEKNKPFFKRQLPLIMKNLQGFILSEAYQMQLQQAK